MLIILQKCCQILFYIFRLYIPNNIKYANTSTEKGEIYNLFKGIEALFSNTDTKAVITDLVNGNSLTNDDFSKLQGEISFIITSEKSYELAFVSCTYAF